MHPGQGLPFRPEALTYGASAPVHAHPSSTRMEPNVVASEPEIWGLNSESFLPDNFRPSIHETSSVPAAGAYMSGQPALDWLPGSQIVDFTRPSVRGLSSASTGSASTGYSRPDHEFTLTGNNSSRFEIQSQNGQAFDPVLTDEAHFNHDNSLHDFGSDRFPANVQREEAMNTISSKAANEYPKRKAGPTARSRGVHKPAVKSSASKRNRNYVPCLRCRRLKERVITPLLVSRIITDFKLVYTYRSK